MKKEIYSWGNEDFEQNIRLDDEYDVFEIETIYSPKIGIARQLTFVDRFAFKAMVKALKEDEEDA